MTSPALRAAREGRADTAMSLGQGRSNQQSLRGKVAARAQLERGRGGLDMTWPLLAAR